MNKLRENEKESLLRIAYWYYKLNMTQAEIAERLGLTRQRVNQLIGMLVDLGVVKIEISGLQDEDLELESAFERAFSLDQAFIFKVEDSENYLELFGEKAAQSLGGIFKKGQKIGVSWGETLAATVTRMPVMSLGDCTVVQMVGGLNSNNKLTKSDEITRMLAEKLGCDYQLLYAPAIVESREAKEILEQDSAFAPMFEHIRNCDVALLGVGELREGATLYRQGYLSREALDRLVEAGCAGDLAMQPFDKDGAWKRLNNIIGVEPEHLAKIPCVIMLACGKKKVEAVLGALRTGCVNVMMIDRAIAREIAEICAL
ncbi:MAG: helix-turn-helix domain-containing protein [Peptococcaceae bacterium]|jgi:DNA-binding transcriptional regulator LsrR (DeoR family)|nr:helix-turn-helix domain-containing protein [Peptococcaceae bacterium]